MNRNGSLTLIAGMFLLVITATLLFQIKLFQAQQHQDRILIHHYREKTRLMKPQ